MPIIVDGKRVGTLLPPASDELTEEQQTFLHRLAVALAISGGAALVVALGLGALLVRGITRPLQPSISRRAASNTIAYDRDFVRWYNVVYNAFTGLHTQSGILRRQTR